MDNSKLNMEQIEALADAIAESVFHRDYVHKYKEGVFELDDQRQICTDPNGNPVYTDAALSQLFLLSKHYKEVIVKTLPGAISKPK